MAGGIAKNTKVFCGERPRTLKAYVSEGSGLITLVRSEQKERAVVSFRFINTDERDIDDEDDPAVDFSPRVYLLQREETTPSTPHLLFPAGMKVAPQRGFMEPGSKDSPICVLGEGDKIVVESVGGAGNIIITISEDSN